MTSTKHTNWSTIIIVAIVLVVLGAIMIPMSSDNAEYHRLMSEIVRCEYSAAGDRSGPNGKCIIKFGADGERHIYWERER